MRSQIKFKENIPIYVQIADDVKSQIIADAISEGDKLSSIREYSVKYSVTALTMQRAFALLETDGIITTKKGVGSFVMEGIQENLRTSLVREHVQAFIDQMTRMGITPEEIMSFVKEGLSNG